MNTGMGGSRPHIQSEQRRSASRGSVRCLSKSLDASRRVGTDVARENNFLVPAAVTVVTAEAPAVEIVHAEREDVSYKSVRQSADPVAAVEPSHDGVACSQLRAADPTRPPLRERTEIMPEYSPQSPSLLNCSRSTKLPVRSSFKTPRPTLRSANVAAAEGPRMEEETAEAFNVANKLRMEFPVQSIEHAGSQKDGREDEESMSPEMSRSKQVVGEKTKRKVCSIHFLTPLTT